MNTIILCNVPNLDINHNHSFTFKNLEQQNKVVYSNMYEFPRSVVLTDKNVFITPIATVTLKRRILKNII